MSYRKNQVPQYQPPANASQSGAFLDTMREDEIRLLFLKLLTQGVHGFCFSLYEDGQKPGDIISEKQIRRRMKIIAPHAKWVRSFSTTEGNELIPTIAKEYGLKTLVGAWLSDDKEKNEEEITGLIKLAQDGFVDIAAVGNEVLYRNDLSLNELISYIKSVKSELSGIPVGYVDAYYEFTRHPDLSDLCDVILTNCYPFWEGTKFDHALNHMKDMYEQSKGAAKGKKVIISETGWPSRGEALKEAEPGEINAIKYFIESQFWSQNENIDLFYFSSFDESWKKNAEGEVGACWGIWDKNEQLKYRLQG